MPAVALVVLALLTTTVLTFTAHNSTAHAHKGKSPHVGADPVNSSCSYWSATAGQNPGAVYNVLYAITAVSNTNVWAVGSTSVVPSGDTETLIEHFNGSQWNLVPSPNAASFADSLQKLAVINANDIWAVGSWQSSSSSGTLAEHWNGTQWSIVPTPNTGGQLTGVSAAASNNVWAVGSISNSQSVVEHWDGSAWSTVTIPLPGDLQDVTTSVVAISSTDAWIIGYYRNSGGSGVTEPLFEHWNGTSWTVDPITNAGWGDSELQSVSASSSTNIWAVGSGGLTGNPNTQSLTEHWNGTTWSVVPSPNVNGNPTFLNDVIALSATTVWAVGTTYVPNPIYREPVVLYWTGNSWNISPAPNPGISGLYSILYGVTAVFPLNVWAAGYIVTNVNGQKPTSQGTIDLYNPLLSIACRR
jgi:hypothetical protein